ncbi:MAG: HlyD family efflux transporter periplasmic adaptor subunit [Pseudoruegeria sp.]
MNDTGSQNIELLPRDILKPVQRAGVGLFIAGVLLVIWACYAPLSTTVRASGTLVSSRPSFDLQHPHNGRVASVDVMLHDEVSEGQILIQLDVAPQKEALSQIEQLISHIEAENAAIETVLTAETLADLTLPDDQSPTISAHYLEMRANLQLELETVEEEARSARQQAEAIHQRLDILTTRRDIMAQRAVHLDSLSQKGLIAVTQTENHRNLFLDLQADLVNEQSDLAATEASIRRIAIEHKRHSADFRLTLLQKKLSNEAQLPELRRSEVNIRDEVAQSAIRAPVSGSIVALHFDTKRMFIPRGTTLLTIAQPLEQPFVNVIIPLQAIDQTRAGMAGALTISSLPQRNLPKIRVTLISIAHDAILDQNGTPTGYRGRATINPDDLNLAAERLNGELSLSADMPVSVAFEGRKTTFSEYLVEPFLTIFKDALQD